MGLRRRACVYIDSCVLIAAFEFVGSTQGPLLKLFKLLEDRPGAAVTSELTLAELLAPVKRMAPDLSARRMPTYLDFFDRGGFVDLVPVSRPILMDTASVRHRHSQRLPDAIHIATALSVGCSFFMTFDQDANRLPQELQWIAAGPEDLAALIKALDA